MATATASPEQIIAQELKISLSGIQDVLAVHLLSTERTLSVWVGIRNDSPQARRHVYELEDTLAKRFREFSFDIRVVPLPEGRRLQDFISCTRPVFERSVA